MKAYERLLKYVVVHTTSDEESTSVPTAKRQFDLANLLVDELKEIGVSDAAVDEKLTNLMNDMDAKLASLLGLK